MIKNTDQSYGLISKILHWVMALIMLGMLCAGFLMESMGHSPLKFQVYGLHKSFGMLILMLVSLRIAWRGISVFPKGLDTHRPWEKILSKIVHILLYAAMIIMPMSGWLMSSAGQFPNIFFGLFEVPALTGKDEALLGLMKQVHGTSALILLGVIALHMAGAFKHHFIDGDATLKRMVSARVGFKSGAVIALVAGILFLIPVYLITMGGEEGRAPKPAVEQAQDESPLASADSADADISEQAQSDLWAIDYPLSSIGFEATQYGQAFSGEFERFTGQIVFNPKDLARSAVDVSIDVASIKTGSDDRDEQARGAEWFDASRYSTVNFKAKSFTDLGANRYEAHGELTIRDVSLPIILPFMLKIEESSDGVKKATMDAGLTLNRLDFGVGQGQWSSAETIGDAVPLVIHLEATQ